MLYYLLNQVFKICFKLLKKYILIVCLNLFQFKLFVQDILVREAKKF